VHNGIYTAFSGLQAQMDALDMLANNLANINTAGFKEQKSFFASLKQELDSPDASEPESALDRAVSAGSALNLSDGALVETHRDLDVALAGNGFLTVETPGGIRYTRNGNLITNANSVLCTSEGFPVLGEGGQITLGPGKVAINQDGEILVNGSRIDRLKISSFDNPASLRSEGSSLLIPAQNGQVAKPASGVVIRQGFQEQSNVNPMLTTVRMVEIMRQYEAIQKGISLMFNELDAKAIEKLPR
jgi:flagellar basal-body rod protein FlgF